MRRENGEMRGAGDQVIRHSPHVTHSTDDDRQTDVDEEEDLLTFARLLVMLLTGMPIGSLVVCFCLLVNAYGRLVLHLVHRHPHTLLH